MQWMAKPSPWVQVLCDSGRESFEEKPDTCTSRDLIQASPSRGRLRVHLWGKPQDGRGVLSLVPADQVSETQRICFGEQHFKRHEPSKNFQVNEIVQSIHYNLTTQKAEYHKFQFRLEKCLLKCTFSGATSELSHQILWQCGLGIWIFNTVDLYAL